MTEKSGGLQNVMYAKQPQSQVIFVVRKCLIFYRIKAKTIYIYIYIHIYIYIIYIYIYSKHFPKNKKTNKQIHKYYKLST